VESSYVTASYPVAVIQGAEQMKITAYVSESLIPSLKVDGIAQISIESAGVSFQGTIRSVDRSANPQIYREIDDIHSTGQAVSHGSVLTAVIYNHIIKTRRIGQNIIYRELDITDFIIGRYNNNFLHCISPYLFHCNLLIYYHFLIHFATKSAMQAYFILHGCIFY
jgi:hypothetical protein